LDFILADSSLLIGFDNAFVLTYFIETQKAATCLIAPFNISALSISPDQDVILVVSSQESLLLFDSQFHEITQVQDLYEAYDQPIEMVNVGWGSKTTQFHGSEGKEAAKITDEVKKNFI